jgi:hypothetical protein
VFARNSNDLKEGGKESVGSLIALSVSKGMSYGRIEYVSLGLYKAIFLHYFKVKFQKFPSRYRGVEYY